MSDFLNLVKVEREKQINKHGYTPEHDDEHTDGSIADAGACYGATSYVYYKERYGSCLPLWKWDFDFFTKEEHDRKQQLIIGAAFYMDEYERIVREEQKTTVHLCDDCNLSFHNCKSNHTFGTAIGNDNVYECDTFSRKPYQMQCPYGFDMAGHSDVVVVDETLIGCIVKTWGASLNRGVHYGVYVRSYNSIVEYDEKDIKHLVYDKELEEES